jgi:hypothetical protein
MVGSERDIVTTGAIVITAAIGTDVSLGGGSFPHASSANRRQFASAGIFA